MVQCQHESTSPCRSSHRRDVRRGRNRRRGGGGAVCAAEQARHAQPLAVEKLPLVNFYAAEDYHQDYLAKNPRGYCHLPAALFKLAREATPQNR